LYPNVISQECLDLVVEITGTEQNIRTGIGLFRKAAERAEREGRQTVTRADVMAASSSVPASSLQTRTAGLRESERRLLYRIATLSQGEGADMRSGAVFEAVQDYLPMGKTAYRSRLNYPPPIRKRVPSPEKENLHTMQGHISTSEQENGTPGQDFS
jgi:archaeal cell division control protein 6